MGDMAPATNLRSAPLHLRQASDLITQSDTSVAANNRYNPPLDSLLARTSMGIKTLTAASDGIGAITKLVELALALVSQAQKTADTNGRARLDDQFIALLTKIDQIEADGN